MDYRKSLDSEHLQTIHVVHRVFSWIVVRYLLDFFVIFPPTNYGATEPGISSDIYMYEPVSFKASLFHDNDWLTPLLLKILQVLKCFGQSKSAPCVSLFELLCKATVEQKKLFT